VQRLQEVNGEYFGDCLSEIGREAPSAHFELLGGWVYTPGPDAHFERMARVP